jgi:nucleotide-binding universal stress UspA family protein
MTAGPFCRVLVGWDGSADAAEALSMAVAIAARHDGHVVALSVVRRWPHTEPDAEPGDDQLGLRHRAEAIFERLRQQDPAASGVRTSIEIVDDDGRKAGPVVCSYAAEYAFDLIVLGRHGGGGTARGHLGQVAKAAAHSAAVPVLLLSRP